MRSSAFQSTHSPTRPSAKSKFRNYWRYFSPILTHMPSACAADVQAAITLIDKTLLSKNNTAIANLKDSFGLGELAHSGDFAGALRNNLWDWQRLQPSSGSNTQFSEFCDSVRWGAVPNAPADGVRALAAWAAYFKDVYLLNREFLPLCAF